MHFRGNDTQAIVRMCFNFNTIFFNVVVYLGRHAIAKLDSPYQLTLLNSHTYALTTRWFICAPLPCCDAHPVQKML